ncbi:MAG: MarR family transcriptional regulator [Thermoanaerobaculia bacterium]
MSSQLQKELKQAKAFPSLEAEVYLGLRLTAQRAREPWARFLKSRTGLSTTQYNLLRILRGAHPEGLTCGEVAERMINRDPDVTRLVDRLAERKLVTRKRDTGDRRLVRIFIARDGLATLKSLDKAVEQFPKQILGQLGKKRLRELRDLLDAMRADMGEFP